MSRTLSCILPNAGPVVQRLGIASMARAAERAGADGLWVSDHILMVDRPVTTYPYSEDGTIAWSTDADYYEALAVLAYLAGVTERCRLGTAVLILPQRNALQLAKEVATIDRLSGGRLELGVGAGWYGDEMTALGYAFETRGTRMDEMLAVMRSAWSGRIQGRTGATPGVGETLILQPTPLQSGGPPIWIGGSSRAALQRAARGANGWMGLGYAHSWDPTAVRGQLSRLARFAAENDRADPVRKILKLHRDGTVSGERMIEVTAEAFAIGFDEVIVEVNWESGVTAAADEFQSIRTSVL